MSDAVERLRREVATRPGEQPFPTSAQTQRALNAIRRSHPHPAPGIHPWIPDAFAQPEAEWRARIGWYVAVDDLGDTEAVFSAVPWPTLDARHRLVFDARPPAVFARPFEVAQAYLNAHRSVAGGADLQDRDLRTGDVFAMSDDALRGLEGTGSEPASVVILDVTGASREQAKIAFYAAATRTIDPRQAPDRDLATRIWTDQRIARGEGREQ